MIGVADTPPVPRSNPVLASAALTVTALCAIVPYAVVALGLRLVIARPFFLEGQAMIDGPSIPIRLGGLLDFSVVLPAEIKSATFQMFATQYAALPLPTTVATYLFAYAAFILPLLLVLGFATRIAAALLLAMTILITLYVAPDAFWTTHIYWISILMVLMSAGPGSISVDRLIRHIHSQ